MVDPQRRVRRAATIPPARAEEEFAEELGPTRARRDRASTSARCVRREESACGPGRCTATSTPRATTSNTFEMEWPPRSGEHRSFPEVDKAAWFTLDEARTKLLAGQLPLLDRLGVDRPDAGADELGDRLSARRVRGCRRRRAAAARW